MKNNGVVIAGLKSGHIRESDLTNVHGPGLTGNSPRSIREIALKGVTQGETLSSGAKVAE